MFFILIAMHAVLVLYVNASVPSTTLWNFLTNMDKWNTLDFLVVIGGIAGALGLSGISSGGTVRFVTDFIVLAPVIGGLMEIGVVFMSLASVIRQELISRIFTGCLSSGGQLCNAGIFFLAVTIAPFAFYYAWTVLEWWRTPTGG